MNDLGIREALNDTQNTLHTVTEFLSEFTPRAGGCHDAYARRVKSTTEWKVMLSPCRIKTPPHDAFGLIAYPLLSRKAPSCPSPLQ